MMNCKEITLLIEKSKDQKLSFKQRLIVKLHLKICKVCHNYAIDSAFLDRLLKKLTVDAKPLDKIEVDAIKKNIETKIG